MNATREFSRLLNCASLRRLACNRFHGQGPRNDDRFDRWRKSELRRVVAAEYELDLAAFLNGLERDELDAVAREHKLECVGRIGALRARLWFHGAAFERGGAQVLGTSVQPVPIVLRGKLVHQGREPAIAPPSAHWPRVVPPPRPAPAGSREEPDDCEQLLAAASRVIGVRLGGAGPGAGKGAFGLRVASLLGVPELGISEPDWRGEIEIKTVPVIRDDAGWWRVKEDPAICMESADPYHKLRATLWLARVVGLADGESTILSWFYQEADAGVLALLQRHLHTRPKGAAGATTRGWYVHKRFFIESGFLLSLNG